MYNNDEKSDDCYNIVPHRWYCPNCSELLMAYPDSSGKVKKRCCNCGAAMTKYKKKRGLHIIEMVEPKHYRAAF